MKRKIRILVDSVLLSILLTACVVFYEKPVKMPCSGDASASPTCVVAWWSSMYERPNPEHLPVRVCFRLLKGLE